MNPPRTLQEEVTAKRSYREEAERRRIERARDDTNRQIEVERKAKVDGCRLQRIQPFEERLDEIDRELAPRDLSEDERVRLLQLRKLVLVERGREMFFLNLREAS